MEIKEYHKLIDQNPELTTDGFGVNTDRYKTEAELRAAFIRDREEIYTKCQEFQSCVDFLTENPHIAEYKHSYNLKHDVEQWIEDSGQRRPWIPQGVFILSAIYMGYKIRREPGWHGAWFSEYPVK